VERFAVSSTASAETETAMTDGATKAHDYRQGFHEGAKAILKAIGDDLPEEQMRVLETWVAGPIADWIQAGPDAKQPTTPMIDGG
jgi:hypothetical protein